MRRASAGVPPGAAIAAWGTRFGSAVFGGPRVMVDLMVDPIGWIVDGRHPCSVSLGRVVGGRSPPSPHVGRFPGASEAPTEVGVGFFHALEYEEQFRVQASPD